jgi:hypothetical protein
MSVESSKLMDAPPEEWEGSFDRIRGLSFKTGSHHFRDPLNPAACVSGSQF